MIAAWPESNSPRKPCRSLGHAGSVGRRLRVRLAVEPRKSWIPPFENESENFVTVYLMARGAREALESGRLAVALAAKFNATLTKLKDERTTEEERKAALAEVARSFGLTSKRLTARSANGARALSTLTTKGRSHCISRITRKPRSNYRGHTRCANRPSGKRWPKRWSSRFL